MVKREAKHQTVFGHWITAQRRAGTPFYGIFELKQTTGNSLSFNATFQSHQKDSLLAIQDEGLDYKPSDLDPRHKPGDYMCTPPLPGYIVVFFSKFRFFSIIPVLDFMAETLESDRRSLTYDRAKEIAVKVIHT